MRWLGFDWGEYRYFASDYFEQLYEWAVELIQAGKAYVDELSADEIREYRGTLTEPGKDSPWRERPIEENLDVFERMRAGEFHGGEKVLRAKIDMASPNINLRDPVIYRIIHRTHPRTGDAWCIYPTYDFAHGQSDAIEGITHSICTLEFQDHRPLYDWFIENLPRALSATPVRVRATEPDPHRPVEARAAPPGRRGLRARMGRSSHAHDVGLAPTRLSRRGDPRLRDDGRGGSGGQRGRGRDARARRARRAQPRGASPLRRPEPPQGGHRELPRGPGRAHGGDQQPRRRGGGHPRGPVRPRAVDRARRLHGGAPREVLPPRPGP